MWALGIDVHGKAQIRTCGCRQEGQRVCQTAPSVLNPNHTDSVKTRVVLSKGWHKVSIPGMVKMNSIRG